jgi:hypothetical protein
MAGGRWKTDPNYLRCPHMINKVQQCSADQVKGQGFCRNHHPDRVRCGRVSRYTGRVCIQLPQTGKDHCYWHRPDQPGPTPRPTSLSMRVAETVRQLRLLANGILDYPPEEQQRLLHQAREALGALDKSIRETKNDQIRDRVARLVGLELDVT